MRTPRCSRPVAMLIALGFLVVGAAHPSAGAEAKAAAAKKPTNARKAAAKPAPMPAKDAVKELVEGEDVRGFRGFCDSWMDKLRERNTFNLAHITWQKSSDGVVGEYTSYGTERTCIAREEPGKDPIGKITYREIRYRKQGAQEAAAQAATPTIVEQTDVTEIFRYGKGRWLY